MKSLLFRLYLAIMKLLARFQRENPQAWVILNGAGRGGSNGYLFYKYLKREHPELDVSLIEPWPSSHLPFSAWKKIGQAKYLFTTHQPFKVRGSQVNVAFWHGIPLKRMGTMANNTKRADNQRNEKLWHRTADLVTSSSDLYESLMSACMGIETHKYQKLGFPRIDALLNPEAKYDKNFLLTEFFQSSLKKDPAAQVGIYLPTFRYELADQEIMERIKQGNFLAFADFDLAKLDQALAKKHQYLLVKLHPYEMKLFASFKVQASHIAFLNNDDLFERDLDLYEFLPATDYLITDFSSIFFDYLHLDKPVIFITNCLDQYQQTRGFLLGPYGEVVPGPQAKRQAELVQLLADLDQAAASYQAKRQRWLQLTDQVDQGRSCQAIYDYLN